MVLEEGIDYLVAPYYFTFNLSVCFTTTAKKEVPLITAHGV